MAVEWKDGIPYLSDDSFIGDVPEYTQLLAKGGGVPVGSIQLWAAVATQYPEGWLPLDGSVTDLEPYPVLKGLFPGGLPNFSGRLPRGTTSAAGNANADYNAGISRHIGVKQIPTHQHRMGSHGHGYDFWYNSSTGATTVPGTGAPPISSFPNTPVNAGGGGVWGYQEVAQNGVVQVDGANNGFEQFDYTNPAKLVVYIMKAG